MAFHSLKVSGTKGELTPLAHERRDLDLYRLGMARVKNWIILKHGGWRRRSGTKYRGNTRNDAAAVFRPYIFSDEQAYLLEFTTGFVRFWVESGQIVDGGGVNAYEVAVPYTTDLDLIQISSYNDFVFIVHPDHPPATLQRNDHNDWTYSVVTFEDGPYLPLNDIDNDLTINSYPPTSGEASRTLTFDVTDNINDGAGFTADDVGRHIRFAYDGRYWWSKIDSVTSTTVVDVTVYQAPTGELEDGWSATATLNTLTWQLGVMRTGENPRAICWHEGRLLYGGFTTYPRGIAASYTDVPTRFSPADIDGTVVDDNGFFREIIRGNADPILWMRDKVRVQIGTSSSIRTIGSKDADQVMTSRNFHAQIEESFGSAAVEPADVGVSTIFADRLGRSLNDLIYDGGAGRLRAPDMSVLAEHLFKKGVRKFAWQQIPDKILWTANGDGKVIGTTFDRDEQITGFHEHDVSGDIEEVEIIPTTTQDEVWMIVKRTIDGNEVRYVETLQPMFDSGVAGQKDAFFVDAGATYEGVSTNTVSGATWLANEEVDLYVDGSPLPSVTVSAAGLITLPNNREGEVISFGLHIDNECTTLPPPEELPNGTRMGRKTRIFAVKASVFETVGLKIGASGEDLEDFADRKTSTPMNQAIELLTDRREVHPEDAWENDAQVTFKIDTPTPGTVLGLSIDVEVE